MKSLIVMPDSFVGDSVGAQVDSSEKMKGFCSGSAAIGKNGRRQGRPTGGTVTSPAGSRGITPACNSDVFPIPDGPCSRVTGQPSQRSATAADSAERP